MSTAHHRRPESSRRAPPRSCHAYNDDVSPPLPYFLTRVTDRGTCNQGQGIERFEDRPPVTSAGVAEASAPGVWQMAPKADTLAVSCGALKTLELLAALEERLQGTRCLKPAHALWAGVRLLGLSGRAPGFGSCSHRDRFLGREIEAWGIPTILTAASSSRPSWQ